MAQQTPLQLEGDALLKPTAFQVALSMITSTNGFSGINSHLTPAELAGVRARPPLWPVDKPVFSPYATTKATGYYTQVKPAADQFIGGQRKSVYCHRAMCRWVKGAPPAGKNQCSHRLGGGGFIQGVERDFNPNNLCWESDKLNKTRTFCQLYYDQIYSEIVAVNLPGPYQPAGFVPLTVQQMHQQAVLRSEAVCEKVHAVAIPIGATRADYLCKYWNPTWGMPNIAVRSHANV